MSGRLLPGGAVIVAVAALVAVAAVASTATRGVASLPAAVACGVLVLIGEVARVTLPGGREVAPVATAAGVGYALVVSFGPEGGMPPWSEVVAVVSIATLLGALPHAAAGRQTRLDDTALRVLAVAAVAGLHRATDAAGNAGLPGWARTAVAVAAVAAVGVGVVAVGAVLRVGDTGGRYRLALREETRELGPLYAAVGATGVLLALAVETMSWWAILVIAAPLLLSQFAFRRYAQIRRTYLQTVRALSRVTEIGGYTEAGHARRVAALAVAVGRDLGMGERDLTAVEYAALMHDIGQLSLLEPIPGGATTMSGAPQQQRVAALGAAVIRQAGVLDAVAEIVQWQAHPWRTPSDAASSGTSAAAPDGTVPLGSRIIRAANAFDDLAGEEPAPDRASSAVEQLRLSTAYEYDPAVVEALSRVTLRRFAPA